MSFKSSSGSGGGYVTNNWSPVGNQIAMSIWLRTTQTTLNVIPFGKCNGATQGGPSIVFNNPGAGQDLMYGKQGGGEPVKATSASTGVFNDGDWHNFIMLYDKTNGGVCQIYLDGVLDVNTTNIGGITMTADPVTASKSYDSFWNAFIGDHAMMACWEGTLDADQIESIGVHRINPGLIARERLVFFVPSQQALRGLWTPGGFIGTIGSPAYEVQPPVVGASGFH